MTFRRQVSLLGVILSFGCSEVTGPASEVNGAWTHDYQIPGMGFEMTLSTRGNVVSGSGQWTGEACCSGPLSVTGTVGDAWVKLDMTFSYTGVLTPSFTQHFEGRILWPNTLSGTLTENGQSIPYSYRRMQ
jgi:hypothetical protein